MMWLYFFLFLFDFVHSHARRGCSSIVCFQVMQRKKVDCKMSTKNFKKTFRDIFGHLHAHTIMLSHKKVSEASAQP